MTIRAAVLHFLFLFLAVRAVAADAGSIAMLVLEPDETKVDVALRPALGDAVPLVRATAARVASVRSRAALLDVLRTQLERESNQTAAREEARAVVLLGGAAEIDRALAASDRFTKQLDAAVAVAVARLGPDVAIPAYFDKLRTRDHVGDFFTQLAWEHPNLRNVLAARFIAVSDARGFRSVISGADIDAGLLVAALRTSPDFRAAATTHILRSSAPVDDRIRAAVADLPAVAGLEDELLRRAAAVPHQPVSLAELLREERNRSTVRGMALPVQNLLTDDERKAMGEEKLKLVLIPPDGSKPLPKRPFRLPSALPEGLGAALLQQTRCRNGWIGLVDVDLDSAGRVARTDVTKLITDDRCRKAAETLLRLSLAEDPVAGAPRHAPVLMVHAAKPDVCLDEEEEFADRAPGRPGDVVGAGVIKPPVPIHKVEPLYPESVRGYDGFVIIESRISARGCISDEQLVKQTPYGEMNGSALLAVDAWTFNPGMLDGRPVKVIFNLTIHFKPR